MLSNVSELYLENPYSITDQEGHGGKSQNDLILFFVRKVWEGEKERVGRWGQDRHYRHNP